MIFTWILTLFISFASFSQSKNEASLTIKITHAKSDEGLIRLLVFDQAVGFPEHVQSAVASYSLPIQHKESKVVIDDLPPGEYAVSVFHDEDNNGELEKHLLGFPSERYGFSNNPKLTFAAPTFENCSFLLEVNQNKHVHIKLR